MGNIYTTIFFLQHYCDNNVNNKNVGTKKEITTKIATK